jgi:hypothetical protein
METWLADITSSSTLLQHEQEHDFSLVNMTFRYIKYNFVIMSVRELQLLHFSRKLQLVFTPF